MNFYLFNFVGNSASSWINTGISFLSLCLTGIIAWFVYNYTHKRWINDVYAKQEAEYWLKYRANIYSETSFFLKVIKNTIPHYVFLFTSSPVETFKERKQLLYELTKLHKFMKPYIMSSKIINFDEIDKLLTNLTGFYEVLVETTSEEDCQQETFGQIKYYSYKNVDNLKYELSSIAHRTLNFKKEDLKDKDYTLINELFETKINQINEALETKVIQHKH